MKQSDLAAKQQQERDEWRKGVGGIVKAVDPAANTITINNAMIAADKPIVIHLSPQTHISPLRSGFGQISMTPSPAPSTRSSPATNYAPAEPRMTTAPNSPRKASSRGAFRDIAGTVVSTDAANNTVTITDLATKKPVTVKVTADSQLRKLPPFVAMGIAMRLKGVPPGAMGAGAPGQGGGGWSGGGQGNGRGDRKSGRRRDSRQRKRGRTWLRCTVRSRWRSGRAGRELAWRRRNS